MSILTKICVVVLVVLILLAAPIFITQATIAPNYRYSYEQEQLRSKSMEQSAHAARLVAERRYEELQEAMARITQLEQRILAERGDSDVKVRELQSALASLQSDKERLNADLAKLATVVQNDQTQIMELTKDLVATRKAITKLNETSLDLKNELEEAVALADRAQKRVKVLQEELARLEGENRVLRGQLAIAPGKPVQEPVAPGPQRELTGRITAVDEDVASINIGSAQGVTKGMRLMVYRGADFVAYLDIDDVQVGQAVGLVVEKRLEPMQGDMVATIPR